MLIRVKLAKTITEDTNTLDAVTPYDPFPFGAVESWFDPGGDAITFPDGASPDGVGVSPTGIGGEDTGGDAEGGDEVGVSAAGAGTGDVVGLVLGACDGDAAGAEPCDGADAGAEPCEGADAGAVPCEGADAGAEPCGGAAKGGEAGGVWRFLTARTMTISFWPFAQLPSCPLMK